MTLPPRLPARTDGRAAVVSKGGLGFSECAACLNFRPITFVGSPRAYVLCRSCFARACRGRFDGDVYAFARWNRAAQEAAGRSTLWPPLPATR